MTLSLKAIKSLTIIIFVCILVSIGCTQKEELQVSKIENYRIVDLNGFPALVVDLKVSKYPVHLDLLDSSKRVIYWTVIENESDLPVILYFSFFPVKYANIKPGTYYISLGSGTPFGNIEEIKRIDQNKYQIIYEPSKTLDEKIITINGPILNITDVVFLTEVQNFLGQKFCSIKGLKFVIENTGDCSAYVYSLDVIIDGENVYTFYIDKPTAIKPSEKREFIAYAWFPIQIKPETYLVYITFKDSVGNIVAEYKFTTEIY